MKREWKRDLSSFGRRRRRQAKPACRERGFGLGRRGGSLPPGTLAAHLLPCMAVARHRVVQRPGAAACGPKFHARVNWSSARRPKVIRARRPIWGDRSLGKPEVARGGGEGGAEASRKWAAVQAWEGGAAGPSEPPVQVAPTPAVRMPGWERSPPP